MNWRSTSPWHPWWSRWWRCCCHSCPCRWRCRNGARREWHRGDNREWCHECRCH
jgi:hypothetical protein